MVIVKPNRNLEWPRGDTYTIRVEVNKGFQMQENDHIMFAICTSETYQPVYSQFADFENNIAVLNIPNSATKNLETGEYFYDLRILRGVEINGDEVTVDDADSVWSFYSPKLPSLTLAEVARNV